MFPKDRLGATISKRDEEEPYPLIRRTLLGDTGEEAIK